MSFKLAITSRTYAKVEFHFSIDKIFEYRIECFLSNEPHITLKFLRPSVVSMAGKNTRRWF